MKKRCEYVETTVRDLEKVSPEIVREIKNRIGLESFLEFISDERYIVRLKYTGNELQIEIGWYDDEWQIA